jgi:hypothetical protein
MAGEWSVSIAQLGLVGGANHSIILVRDAQHNIQAEINGGPLGPNGQLASWTRDPQLFLPGAAPLRAQVNTSSRYYYEEGLPEQMVLVGSESDIRAALQAGIACTTDINAAGYS